MIGSKFFKMRFYLHFFKNFSLILIFCFSVICFNFEGCGDKNKSNARFIGEIKVEPSELLAGGETPGRVAVTVYFDGSERKPVSGAEIKVFSSRNQGDEVVDLIIQPDAPTDENGSAIAFIRSSVEGEAVLSATVNGVTLCSSYENGNCSEAHATVKFVLECSGGLENCGGLCVDIQSDTENCGGCGKKCEVQNGEPVCNNGQCEIKECFSGWDDCNNDVTDGCEINIDRDNRNCGGCGIECDEGYACVSRECVECYDNDGDGFPSDECGGLDCNDDDPEINPDADEVCDGVDNDCDTRIDEQPEASASCDDGDLCDGLERCAGGRCVEGLPADCDDANPCTIDTCDPEGGCINTIAEDGTACGEGIMGECDREDTCVSGICQPNVAPPGTVCRESAGDCDLPEFCDGVSYDCPENELKPPGTVCRESRGDCDVAEFCTGLDPNCPWDSFQPSSVLCRSQGGACDTPEYCPGDGPACPEDRVSTAGTVCRPSSGVCDIEERCDGVSKTCPSDRVADRGIVCRPASNECDAEEVCDGENVNCPNNGFLPDGTLCTSDGLFCTGIEECRSGVCISSGNPCSNPAECNETLDRCGTCGNGIVESGEECESAPPKNDHCCNSATCRWIPSGGADPQGVCVSTQDCVNVVCNGSGGCLSQQMPDGTPCGDQTDTACDNPDTCFNGSCQSNLEPAGTVCRTANGICDVEERCDGVNPSCPSDAVQPPTVVCRAASGVCDVAERCDGVNKTCPSDGYAPSGTPCPDNDPCTDDFCNGLNVCVHTPASNPSSNPNWECFERTCDGVDNDCDGCVDENCGGGTVVSVKVIPFSDGPGLRRISGNAQFGPAGRRLPGKLVVQLNDSNGNPLSCERIRFAIERAGTVCFGKGGRFVTDRVRTDPEIRRVCNDVGTGTIIGGPEVLTDQNGQAGVELEFADAVGTTVVSATAVSTGEKVFFVETAVPRLSSTLTLPPPSPVENPALGPLDVTVGTSPTRTFMGNKNNYTLTIDNLTASTGTTNGVPSAPLSGGGTLTITGTQFTDSQPVQGSCGGAPLPGYPKVWIGGIEVTPTSVTNTQIVVPIPEGLPGAASVIVNDGTNTTFKSGTGCVPSVANAMAGFWRVPPSPPVFISAKTGSLNGSSVKVKILALDSCGNPLSLNGRTVNVWTENPDGTTPSTSVSVSPPDSAGVVTVSALSTGVVRAAFIGASVDGVSTGSSDKAVVVPVPVLQPGTYTGDPALANNDGINSLIYRGGDESGGIFDTVHVNPAMRMQTVNVVTYDLNWMCTVGIISSCECPAVGRELSSTCGSVYETEKNIVLATVKGEGDLRNLAIGTGNVAVGGTSFLDIMSGFSQSQGSGGLMGILSAQVSYEVSISSGVKNADGTVHTGWLRQNSSEQEIETNASGLELYNDRGNSNPADDEIRNLLVRILFQRAMP